MPVGGAPRCERGHRSGRNASSRRGSKGTACDWHYVPCRATANACPCGSCCCFATCESRLEPVDPSRSRTCRAVCVALATGEPPPTPRCAQHLKVSDDPFYMAWCAIMSSTLTQKNIVNDLYHAAVVGGLAIGYAKLGQMVFKGPLPRLDLTPCDAGMAILDLSAAIAKKDMLIKQGLIPSDIVV